jgi:hypothetical protein
MKKLVLYLSFIVLVSSVACKAKKCPTFVDGGKRLDYKKNGLVKKRK